MTAFTFQKATKKRSKLRLALDGPSGSGKTYTALVAATAMAEGGKIAVIDTERGSASLYSDKFNFDVLELDTFSPAVYTEAILAAENAGYSVIVIDSLSHAWEGEGGALEMVDQAAARNKGNSYVSWRDVTPLHRKMVDAILQSPAHVIVTMRSKMDYIQEKGPDGKTVIRKVGMAPIQRQGMEYEFTIVGDMDVDHKLIVSKSRCDFVADAVETKPKAEFFKRILDWLNSGADAPVTKPAANTPPPAGKPEPVTQTEAPASARPYAPEKLKAVLERKAAGLAGKDADQATRNMVAANLELCFAGPNATAYRKSFTRYIFGESSTKTMPASQVLALKAWLHMTQDSGGAWAPDAMAVTEANTALTEALKAEGQEELFGAVANAA